MSTYSKAHICQCLTRLSTVRRNSPVTISGARRKNGQQFVQGVLALAQGLTKLGLRSGHVVAIAAFNSDEYLEWLLAVAFVGGIVAPLNYRWSFQEIKSAILAVKPVMLVSDESCSRWYSDLDYDSEFPFLRWRVFIGSNSLDSMKLPNSLATETIRSQTMGDLDLNFTWAPDGAAIVCFTSGTTGKPKGAVISHSALIVQSLAKVAIVGYSEEDVYLHLAPLCHIGGLSSALTMLMVGACHVLIPKFEATAAVDAIEKHSVTSFITVPTIMVDLISSITMKENWRGKHSVKKILNGGGSLPPELIGLVANFFPQARLLSAYGMTETSSSLTFMALHDPTVAEISRQSQGPEGVCVGMPAPHVELKVNRDGRILTRGPHVMLGYWDQYTAPQRLEPTVAIWLDTGDAGSLDDSGNLWLVGRINDRIKTGGENVHPAEIEAVLLQHPGVIGAVVVGIPDARLAELVVGCIQLRESWEWSDSGCCVAEDESRQVLCSETLTKYCRAKNLTGFKAPRMFVRWKEEFPRTSTGKIRRDQVRREVMSRRLLSISSNL
ncbi:unnamed protein product [Linum trigynum]|uniref:2-succinylbenzoate--CoA ligase, chloroplastic/peroxisomal n=1 Tax=Linum trigynum TaxID=586398 RepID=A0AAV2FZ95_9ROSI